MHTNTHCVFALLPIGTAFKFAGNPIQFVKKTDFQAEGFTGYKGRGSFLVNAIYGEFNTMAWCEIVAKIDLSVDVAN